MLNSLRELAVSLVSHLRTRIALVKLEVEREKSRLAVMAAAIVLALLFCVLTLVIASFGIIAYYWDTNYRMYAVWSITVFFLLATIISLMVLRAKLKTRSALFESSLAELHKDQDLLEGVQ